MKYYSFTRGWESRNERAGIMTHILPGQSPNYKSGEIYIIVQFNGATVKTVLFLSRWKRNCKNEEGYHYLPNKIAPLISISVLWQGEFDFMLHLTHSLYKYILPKECFTVFTTVPHPLQFLKIQQTKNE